MATRTIPYGLWPSGLTPDLLGNRIRLGDVQWGQNGKRLVWLEGRSGWGTLVQSIEGAAPQDLTNPGHNVRGSWGYGGGEFAAGSQFVLYTEKAGRLFRQDYAGTQPVPLTGPEYQISAPVLHPILDAAVCVAAQGDDEFLALVPTKGLAPLVLITRGADFYMQPSWSPDGLHLAWIQWDHPGLPWEGCQLVLADFNPDSLQLSQPRVIAGGENSPVFQPAFSPDGRWLAYIAETGEFEDLILLDLQTGQTHALVSGAVLSQPAWEQGLRMFTWQADGKGILFTRLNQGHSSLWQINLQGSAPRHIPQGRYTWLDHLNLSPDGRLAGIAAAVDIPSEVVCGVPGDLLALRSSQPALPSAELSPAEPISWQSGAGTTLYGLFSSPQKPGVRGIGLPPAILYIHGGPTTQRFARFEVERSYFTSRGYAWLDVDYRGSTGYGRAYRQALYGNWGLIDVDDVLSAAGALIQQGLAHPQQLILYGSSAGGFSLLNAMIRQPGRFHAGLCLYPVTNLLKNLSTDFKLEKFYHTRLLGDLPQAEEAYHQRSPLTHASELSDPLLLFHGMDDPVVPVEQSQAIASALQARGTPCELHLYPGEGHGFRKVETVADMYHQMENFLHQHLQPGAAG